MAFGEHVISVISESNFFEFTASSKNVSGNSVSGSLEDSTGGFGNSLNIFNVDSTSAENSSVGEILSSKITNWLARKNNLSSSLNDMVKLGINDVPFSINDLLEIIWVFNSNFSIILLGFQFKLDVEDGNLWVSEHFWCLFETGI